MSKPKFKDLVLEICLKYGKDDFMWSFLNRLYFTNLAKQTLPFHNNRHKIYELMLALNGREKYEKSSITDAEYEKDFDFIVKSIADLMKENGVMKAISQQNIYDEVDLCMQELGLKEKNTERIEHKDLKPTMQDYSSNFTTQSTAKLPPLQYIIPLNLGIEMLSIDLERLSGEAKPLVLALYQAVVKILSADLNEKYKKYFVNDIAIKEYLIYISTLFYANILDMGFDENIAFIAITGAFNDLKKYVSEDMDAFGELTCELCSSLYSESDEDLEEMYNIIIRSFLIRLYLTNIKGETIPYNVIGGYVGDFLIPQHIDTSKIIESFDFILNSVFNIMEEAGILEILTDVEDDVLFLVKHFMETVKMQVNN